MRRPQCSPGIAAAYGTPCCAAVRSRHGGTINAYAAGTGSEILEALKSDMTMTLGLDGVEDGHARPMTAQLEGERPPIWFFMSRDNEIVQKLGAGDRAIATIASKDHELFATVHGRLAAQNDRAVIDRLWNMSPRGMRAPRTIRKLVLLRLDAKRAQIWETRRRFLPGSNCYERRVQKEGRQSEVGMTAALANEGTLQMFNPDTKQD